MYEMVPDPHCTPETLGGRLNPVFAGSSRRVRLQFRVSLLLIRAMTAPILYLGDTSRDTAAAYLLSLLAHWGWECEYVPSDQPLNSEVLDQGHSLFVLSDYPAAQVSDDLMQRMVEQVAEGVGLLMIGGWESFHGLGGDWDGTPIAETLPVTMSAEDDRQNCDHPVLLRCVGSHACVEGLPWQERPPLIGGFNRVTAKPESTVLLDAVHFIATETEGQFTFTAQTSVDPLLVVGQHGQGRTAAFMTDVAPHWVGPLVDWGSDRVAAKLDDAVAVEVGNLYAAFLQQLLGWVGGRKRE